MSCSRPTKFAHVVYRTRKFDEMLNWYQTVFDARVQHQNPVMAFMTYDDEHHRFAFVDMAALQPTAVESVRSDVVGVDHVAYTYGSIDDLLENYELLKSRGIVPYWCIHHGVTVSMYYADPDGNQMEFQVDAFDSAEESSNYLIERFADNPVGVEYDPDEWLLRYREGEPGSSFLARESDEPISPIRGNIAAMI